jgi:hypothetical protein
MSSAFVFLLVIGLQASAGNRVGNGGNVVLCEAAAPVLLDFYEASENGRKISSYTGAKYSEILEQRLKLLEKVAPKLAAQYKKRVTTIVGEFDFKGQVTLVNADDSVHAFKPADEKCAVKQTAIRRTVFEGSKRFAIDNKIWERMNGLQKAGLIMHEVVYEHFAKLGETDSRTARRLNALLFSDDLQSMTSGKFWLFIKELAIPLYP